MLTRPYRGRLPAPSQLSLVEDFPNQGSISCLEWPIFTYSGAKNSKFSNPIGGLQSKPPTPLLDKQEFPIGAWRPQLEISGLRTEQLSH